MNILLRAMSLWFLFTMLGFQHVNAQQLVDKNYSPQNSRCYFCNSKAPVVAVDAAHFNYHSIDNRFRPFAKVLRSDGFNVMANQQPFSEQALEGVDVLVIANALNEKNSKNWDLPNYSAFARGEIEALYNWVKQGGSLFLIADHLPWPAASAELASMFGFSFFNGYVEVTDSSEQFFSLEQKSLLAHPILTSGTKPITQIQGFMGQGFLIPPQAEPLLRFTQPSISWMPAKSWKIEQTTPYFDATGFYQGAVLKFHRGKLAVFGEAGMFTAQVIKENDTLWKMGLNAEKAEQNEQFLLNIIHWLAGNK